jgi:hypothetical protein
MSSKRTNWTKTELQIYILFLCANADSVQSEDEMNLIKSKVDEDTFNKIYKEFSGDTEEVSLQKIEKNVATQEYSHKELVCFRREMHEVFFTDKHFSTMERHMEKILKNMLY